MLISRHFFLVTESSDECVNTRDKASGNTCAKQLGRGSSCMDHLKWKDCDKDCNLCACSTASGVNKEHCSGHGTCEAICTKETCTVAKCKCDNGWTGDKCEKGNEIYLK